MSTTHEVAGERRQLIHLAYRLLGSLSEAEDAAQEAYTRWYALPERQRHAVDNPAAWLTRVASRICLDQLRSARVRRERYAGPWLPEPLPAPDPADRVTLDDSISMAFLVVLESMTPAERVAVVLHDVFDYPFAEIAEIVGRTPAACRQLATSGRRRVSAARSIPVPAGRQAGVVREFRLAWEAADIGTLIGLLDPAVTVTADGGGRVSTLPRPLRGTAEVARYGAAIVGNTAGLTILERTVNGRPGLVTQRDGVIETVLAFDLAGDRIRSIWIVRNPEKLHAWIAHSHG
ncbi:RNA polymerase sigma factor SigJ [Actinoplanes aureus]|uniref:RNA polymerase sigma factor SigJ n=1 Tax=Actinoplanes aureus TaxID=2792083 RepID=UPI00281668AE|nr:RNA polymerase sigma factor SigJ [Actinoplanes aureus]